MAAARVSRCTGLPRLASALRTHNTHAQAQAAGIMDVAVVDPLLVLEPERLAAAVAHAAAGGGDAAAVQPFVTVGVPFRLLAQLHQGRLELADHDDPGNHWIFGKQAELFQYAFQGRHTVQSGFTSLVQAHELQQLLDAPPERHNRKQAGERSWLAFLQHVQGSSGEGLWPTPSLPFLFAGKAIDCASVGVYTVGGGGSMQGIMLSTEYDTPGAD